MDKMEKSSCENHFRALGTDIHIEIVVENDAEKKKAAADLETVERLYCEKQKIFCRFSGESELAMFNRRLGEFEKASPDFLHLAQSAIRFHALSGGLYDPRIIQTLEAIGYNCDFRKMQAGPIEISNDEISEIKGKLEKDLLIEKNQVCFKQRMDFTGIAKGYITDLAADFLKDRGWKNFLVDSGGDMFAAGKNREEDPWRIEIEGIPENKLTLSLSEKGIATSGISRKKWEAGGKQFHHLVNPLKPGEFSFELRTVTVIRENTENADGRAKVLMLMGKQEGMGFAKRNKIAAIFFDYRGNVIITPEAKKFVLT